MNWLEALILGILQGLAEFLPISSSGHLEIGKVALNVEAKDNLTFTVVVHGATVLSTIIVFWKDIISLFKGIFQFRWNPSTRYVSMILVSMIPVMIVGLFFKDHVESLFTGNLILVGSMLIVTAILLTFTIMKESVGRDITFLDSIIIGIAQAMAVLPGISRSGATIATGLLLGKKKEDIAKFSFLMVLIPILGANMKDLFSGDLTNDASMGLLPLIIGFLAAFISGLLACKWMLKIVKEGKLVYFAVYCMVIGVTSILTAIYGS